MIIGGCKNSNTFTVKGGVAGAVGQSLYLEHTGLSTATTLDSVKLKSDGKFSFKQPRPKFPDFYRLKLKNETIHFSVDSTETIIFTADSHNFATSYTVEGSENSKAFKEITLAQLDANQELRKIRESFNMNLIPDSIHQESISKVVESYKEVAKKFIFGAPMSPAAYFALFQKIDGLLFFDLYDSTDSRAFGAVATSYKAFYPENPRSKQLEDLALQSLKIARGERQRQLNLTNVNEVDYIDIELPDLKGKNIKLSDVAKGKAVLVSFTAYQTEWSSAFNIELGELFYKYKDKGFEIYQISLDNDVHFWKNAATNIPWVSVLDPQSVNSSIAATYNVRQLPALFLINNKGQLVKRIDSIETLENDVKAAI
jgi:glutathione peroxidase-family protein